MPKRRHYSFRGGAVHDTQDTLVGHDNHFLTPYKTQKLQEDVVRHTHTRDPSDKSNKSVYTYEDVSPTEQSLDNLGNTSHYSDSQYGSDEASQAMPTQREDLDSEYGSDEASQAMPTQSEDLDFQYGSDEASQAMPTELERHGSQLGSDEASQSVPNDVEVEDVSEAFDRHTHTDSESTYKFPKSDYFELNPVEQKLARLMLRQRFEAMTQTQEAKRERAGLLYVAQYQVEKAKQFCKVVGTKVVVLRPARLNTTYFQIWLHLCCEYVKQETERFEHQGADTLGEEWASMTARAIRQMYKVIESSLLLSKVKTKITDLERCVYAINPSLSELIYDDEYHDDDEIEEDFEQDREEHQTKNDFDYDAHNNKSYGSHNKPAAEEEKVEAFCQAQECIPGETVATCYKKTALHKHPDKNGKTEDFQELNLAYHNLKDSHLEKEVC